MSYPLATSSWDAEELQALQDVIASDRFTMGEHVARFESAFAEAMGARYAVMVNSGSSANLLAVATLRYMEGGLVPGDEVIVPAVSWSTTYSPLTQLGLRLRFVDVDPNTLNLTRDGVSAAITPRTKAIFAVNLLGNPADYSQLVPFADERGLILIEDNCESMGATLGGRAAGTFGRLGTFSSFFSHHISTMEGGVVVTDDEESYHLMLSLRSHGWTRHLPEENRLVKKSEDPFFESFRFILPGFNLRPLELSGAVGCRQLEKLPGIVSMRRKNAAVFREEMRGVSGVLLQEETGASSWFGFSLVFEHPEVRQKIIETFRRHEVECRPIVAGNFLRSDALKHFDYSVSGAAPHADRIHDCGLFIGNHHYDVAEQLADVAALIKGVLDARG